MTPTTTTEIDDKVTCLTRRQVAGKRPSLGGLHVGSSRYKGLQALPLASERFHASVPRGVALPAEPQLETIWRIVRSLPMGSAIAINQAFPCLDLPLSTRSMRVAMASMASEQNRERCFFPKEPRGGGRAISNLVRPDRLRPCLSPESLIQAQLPGEPLNSCLSRES
jgi:hypothetical protein